MLFALLRAWFEEGGSLDWFQLLLDCFNIRYRSCAFKSASCHLLLRVLRIRSVEWSECCISGFIERGAQRRISFPS